MAEPRLRGTISTPLRFDERDLRATTYGDRHDLSRAKSDYRLIYIELGREGWVDGHPTSEIRHRVPVITDLPERPSKKAPVPPKAKKNAAGGRGRVS